MQPSLFYWGASYGMYGDDIQTMKVVSLWEIRCLVGPG